MKLNIFHILVNVFIFIMLVLKITRANIDLKNKEKLNSKSLESVFFYILISLFWIFYGVYSRVDSMVLAGEGFVVGLAMIGFVAKINKDESIKLFGKNIPGHGIEETKFQKKLKWILLVLAILSFILIPFLYNFYLERG